MYIAFIIGVDFAVNSNLSPFILCDMKRICLRCAALCHSVFIFCGLFTSLALMASIWFGSRDVSFSLIFLPPARNSFDFVINLVHWTREAHTTLINDSSGKTLVCLFFFLSFSLALFFFIRSNCGRLLFFSDD